MKIFSAAAVLGSTLILAACGGQALGPQAAPNMEVVFPPVGANFNIGLSSTETRDALERDPSGLVFADGEWETTVVVRMPADSLPRSASVNGVPLQPDATNPELWAAEVPIYSGTSNLRVQASFSDGMQSSVEVQLANEPSFDNLSATSVQFEAAGGFLYASDPTGIYRQQVDLNMVERLADIKCMSECPLALADNALYSAAPPASTEGGFEWIVEVDIPPTTPAYSTATAPLYLQAAHGLVYDSKNAALWVAEYADTGSGADSLYRYDLATGTAALAEVRASDDPADPPANIIGANDLVATPDGRTLFVWSSRISKISVIALEEDQARLIGTVDVEAIRRSSADAQSAFAIDFSQQRIYFTNRDLQAMVRADFSAVLDMLDDWRSASKPQLFELRQRDESFTVEPEATNGPPMSMDMDANPAKYNTSITLNEADQIAYVAGSGYLLAVSLLTGDRVALQP